MNKDIDITILLYFLYVIYCEQSIHNSTRHEHDREIAFVIVITWIP